MEKIKLDLIPSGKMPSLHASQYDDGRDYHIDLTENRVPYVLDGTETISLTVRKCDNTLVTMDIANTFADKSYIEFRTTEQMNACAGFNYGEITIEKNGTQISSLNFYLQVEGAPDEGGITSQSEINNLARQVHDFVVEELEDNGASDTGYDNTESGLEATNVQDAIDEVNAKIENIPSVDAYTKQESDQKYATKTALEEVSGNIPTKTSQLQNDSGFATIEDLDEKADSDDVYTKKEIDKSLKEPLRLFDATTTNNLINPLDCTDNYYIDITNGSLIKNSGYIVSGFIMVDNSKNYTTYSIGRYAFYDENKEFISGANSSLNGLPPANAEFIRVDFPKTNRDSAFLKACLAVPFNKNYGVYFPWLVDKNLIDPDRFKQWGSYYPNLFNKYTAIDGYYVNHTTGKRSGSASYFLSDYIKVDPNTTYVMSSGNRYAAYDKDFQFISGANLSGDNVEFTTPSGAEYILVCNTPLSQKDLLVVAKKTHYSEIYESFGIVVPWIKPLVAKSRYDGKKLVCFGDSITFMGYTDTIKADTGIIAQNVGLSSGRYAYSDDSNVYINAFAFYHIVDSIVSGDWTIPDSINGVSGYTNQYQQIQDIKAIDFNTVDFVSIAYGTNDFSSATEIDNINDPLDTNTFKGAIRYCLKKLTEAYPNLKIIGVTPCYRFWSENGSVLYDSDEHTIGGMYLSEFVEAIESVYSEYHLPFVNNYNNAGINKYNRLQYFNITDGLHPKINGRAILGHRIGSGILENY